MSYFLYQNGKLNNMTNQTNQEIKKQPIIELGIIKYDKDENPILCYRDSNDRFVMRDFFGFNNCILETIKVKRYDTYESFFTLFFNVDFGAVGHFVLIDEETGETLRGKTHYVTSDKIKWFENHQLVIMNTSSGIPEIIDVDMNTDSLDLLDVDYGNVEDYRNEMIKLAEEAMNNNATEVNNDIA